MTEARFKDVDDYIMKAPEAAQKLMQDLRKLINQTVPEATEGISYNVPYYKYLGELVGFSVFKAHLSFGYGAGILTPETEAELKTAGYKLGKGTLQIRFDQSLPIEQLKKILRQKVLNNQEKNTK